MVSVLFVTLLGIILCFKANANYNGLGQKPPMGYISPLSIHGMVVVTENVIRGAADALISTGLSKLGYEYVNTDDCWGEKHRDPQGNLIAKVKTFRSGIKVLADYGHSKGLKLGIYADAGRAYYARINQNLSIFVPSIDFNAWVSLARSQTCSSRMTGYIKPEEEDANTFASWGVDYLTYRISYITEFNPLARLYWEGPKIANSWLSSEIGYPYEHMLEVADQNNELAAYAGPDRGWNDADVLHIGRIGPSLTVEE
ncbi:hypothetical protein SUGI_0713830 [Cryptomeria japonica]|nr:hypothetical protein SUGI_0713830 [Cryptomeria japonica]